MPAKRSRPKKSKDRPGWGRPPASKAPSKGLTPKQEAFVREYLVDLNATQAAIRAGYAPKSAYSQGQRLLKNVEIKAQVEKALQDRSERTGITQDRVLEELQHMAFSNVDDYAVSPEGRLVPAEGRPPEVMRAVSSVKYRTRATGKDGETVREVEFRLWDKPNTLKLAGRHTGLFPNEVKVEMGEGTLADILKMAHELNARPEG